MTTFKIDCDPWGVTVERVEVPTQHILYIISYTTSIYQVKSLVVAREMVVPMASIAKAAREANGLVILQKGEARCLQEIRSGNRNSQ